MDNSYLPKLKIRAIINNGLPNHKCGKVLVLKNTINQTSLCKRCEILHLNKNGYRYKFDQYQNLAAFIDASHDIANIIIQCTLGPAAK